MFNKRLWKFVFGLVVLLTGATAVVIMLARAPNREVCLTISGNNPHTGDTLTGLVDLNRGRLWLSAAPPHFAHTSISPDSKHWIGVWTGRAGASQVVTAVSAFETDAANRTVLLQAAIADVDTLFAKSTDMVWSADNQSVSFLWTAQSGQHYLTSTRLDGTNQRTVEFTGADANFRVLNSWSADDRYLLIARPQEPYTIWSVTDGRVVNRIAQFERGAWSPQGHRFAGIRGAQLMLWTPEHEVAIPLTLTHGQSVDRVVWSPNGHYLTVQSFRTCAAPEPCTTRRVYDIFSADGKQLVANLSGGDWEDTNINQPTEAWLADGQTWLFVQLQADTSVPTATDALITLHIDPVTDTPTYQTLGTHLVNAFVDDLFYTNPFFNHSDGSYASVLDTSHILFMTRNASANPFAMTLMDTASQKSTLLVQDATSIIVPNGWGQFWLNEGHYVFFGWATRTTTGTVAQHLSWALYDGSERHGLSTTFSHIEQVQLINTYNNIPVRWLGFIGVQNGKQGFYLADLTTGDYHVVIESVAIGTTYWYGFQAPSTPQLQLMLSAITPQGQQGALYLVDTNTLTSQQLGSQVKFASGWSTAQSEFAFIYLTQHKELRLTVVSRTGKPLKDYSLKTAGDSSLLWFQGWSQCNVS